MKNSRKNKPGFLALFTTATRPVALRHGALNATGRIAAANKAKESSFFFVKVFIVFLSFS